MKKKTILWNTLSLLLIVVLCAALLISCKKHSVVTIGIVNANPNLESVVEGFKAELAKQGFVEQKNVVYLYKGVARGGEIEAVLKDLVGKKVDLILAVAGTVAKKAKEATEGTGIPVVFAPALYPVEMGLVSSLIRPGGNLTGIQIGGNAEKALELHVKSRPATRKIFVPCWCGDEAAELSLADLKKAARKLRIGLVTRDVDSVDQLKAALDVLPDGVDSLWLLNSVSLSSRVDLFVEAALKRKLMLSSSTSQYKKGVMISYAHDSIRTGERAARLAHRILDGVSPGDLPVEMAEFKLGINLRTAQAAGVTIPDDILNMADDIVR